MADTYAYDHGIPCLNPNCKSHGRPHPNCKCYSGGGNGTGLFGEGHDTGPEFKAESYFGYAKGGQVCAQNAKHHPSCIYYSEGGEVHDDHSVIHHGLLGLLKDVGQSKLNDPNRHIKDLEKIKNHLSDGNPDKAARLFDSHALAGSALKKHSNPIMGRLASSIVANPSNPEGLKSASEYLSNVSRGHDKIDEHVKSMLGAKSNMNLKPDKGEREALDQHFQSLKEDQSKMMNVGGSLGHYLPDQAIRLGALASTATEYFDTIKPKPVQVAPLDTIPEVSKMAQAKYDRQLDIAQKPSLALQHVKDGTLQPQDLVTIKTLYPGLHQSMLEKASQALIQAKKDDVELPYKQKRSLSLLLGQPLDSTMTSGAMQAIMKAQGPQQVQNQARTQQKKASNVELNQINKVNKMALTPLEARQADRKD